MEKIKKAMLIAHNNTHSVGRIIRAADYFLRDPNCTEERKQKSLDAIITAANECKKQVDELYSLIKL